MYLTDAALLKASGEDDHKHIKTLDLHFQSNRGKPCIRIEGLEKCKNLEELILANHQITKLEGLETLRRLATLDVSFNNIRRLEGLPTRLETLNVNNNEVTRLPSRLGQLTTLKVLRCANNSISQLRDVFHLRQCTNLTRLELCGNPIADLDHYRLWIAFALPSLHMLDSRAITNEERSQARDRFDKEELETLLELNAGHEARVAKLEAELEARMKAATVTAESDRTRSEELLQEQNKTRQLEMQMQTLEGLLKKKGKSYTKVSKDLAAAEQQLSAIKMKDVWAGRRNPHRYSSKAVQVELSSKSPTSPAAEHQTRGYCRVCEQRGGMNSCDPDDEEDGRLRKLFALSREMVEIHDEAQERRMGFRKGDPEHECERSRALRTQITSILESIDVAAQRDRHRQPARSPDRKLEHSKMTPQTHNSTATSVLLSSVSTHPAASMQVSRGPEGGASAERYERELKQKEAEIKKLKSRLSFAKFVLESKHQVQDCDRAVQQGLESLQGRGVDTERLEAVVQQLSNKRGTLQRAIEQLRNEYMHGDEEKSSEADIGSRQPAAGPTQQEVEQASADLQRVCAELEECNATLDTRRKELEGLELRHSRTSSALQEIEQQLQCRSQSKEGNAVNKVASPVLEAQRSEAARLQGMIKLRRSELRQVEGQLSQCSQALSEAGTRSAATQSSHEQETSQYILCSHPSSTIPNHLAVAPLATAPSRMTALDKHSAPMRSAKSVTATPTRSQPINLDSPSSPQTRAANTSHNTPLRSPNTRLGNMSAISSTGESGLTGRRMSILSCLGDGISAASICSPSSCASKPSEMDTLVNGLRTLRETLENIGQQNGTLHLLKTSTHHFATMQSSLKEQKQKVLDSLARPSHDQSLVNNLSRIVGSLSQSTTMLEKLNSEQTSLGTALRKALEILDSNATHLSREDVKSAVKTYKLLASKITETLGSYQKKWEEKLTKLSGRAGTIQDTIKTISTYYDGVKTRRKAEIAGELRDLEGQLRQRKREMKLLNDEIDKQSICLRHSQASLSRTRSSSHTGHVDGPEGDREQLKQTILKLEGELRRRQEELVEVADVIANSDRIDDQLRTLATKAQRNICKLQVERSKQLCEQDLARQIKEKDLKIAHLVKRLRGAMSIDDASLASTSRGNHSVANTLSELASLPSPSMMEGNIHSHAPRSRERQHILKKQATSVARRVLVPRPRNRNLDTDSDTSFREMTQREKDDRYRRMLQET